MRLPGTQVWGTHPLSPFAFPAKRGPDADGFRSVSFRARAGIASERLGCCRLKLAAEDANPQSRAERGFREWKLWGGRNTAVLPFQAKSQLYRTVTSLVLATVMRPL